MRRIIKTALALLTATLSASEKPNFIIVFTDDQGYADLGCYGGDVLTPRIDQMASEGLLFTDFYAQTVCGPSRAAIMTGSYPLRIAREDSQKGPHPEMAQSEVTIPEILKPLNYKTAMLGKWDLAGHRQKNFNPDLTPLDQGFDYAFWTPSSNDAIVNLYDQRELIEEKADMSLLTKRYTDKALDFIRDHKEDAFFVYLAHTMPHTKLAVSQEFKGKTGKGMYADVIAEIDYNLGRLLDEVKALGIDDNTYVIFTSDNGPWWIRKDHGGSALPLRAAKTSCYEGGFRVPCIVRAPGKVPAGATTNAHTATIDLLPTIAQITGAKAPSDRVIDGLDISTILSGESESLERAFFYYQHTALRAVRKGQWKLHIPHVEEDKKGFATKWANHIPKADRPLLSELTLYNLKSDIGETTNVANENPDIVQDLLNEIASMKADLGSHTQLGKNCRYASK